MRASAVLFALSLSVPAAAAPEKVVGGAAAGSIRGSVLGPRSKSTVIGSAAAKADPAVAEAKKHFEAGREHHRAGRYADAVKEFEAANAIKPHPTFLYDMAQSYRLAGDAAHAIEMYRAYLAVDSKGKNRLVAERHIQNLQKQLLANPLKNSDPARGATTGQASVAAVQPAAQVIAPAKKGLTGLVAVLEFRSKLEGEEKKAVDASYLADVVRSAALKAGPGLEVITRENLVVMLKATGKSIEDCEGECEVETGRKVGADLVVSGDVLRFGSSFKLALKLHETSSGKLVSTAIATGKSVDELDAEAQRAAVDLLVGSR